MLYYLKLEAASATKIAGTYFHCLSDDKHANEIQLWSDEPAVRFDPFVGRNIRVSGSFHLADGAPFQMMELGFKVGSIVPE